MNTRYASGGALPRTSGQAEGLVDRVARPCYFEAAMARVKLTRHLHSFFPQLQDREIEVEASCVAEVVAGLEKLAPGIAFYICDERGRLRTHVNIFIGNERIRDRGRLSDPVGPGAEVHILQSLSGG